MRPTQVLWIAGLASVAPLSPVPAQAASSSVVEFLLPGEFLGRGVFPATGEEWFGLYSTPAGYDVHRTRVAIARVPNACAGSATRIIAEGALTPLFLLRGLSLKEGPVDTAFAGRKILYPGESVSFHLATRAWYAFDALGSARESGVIKDYTLRLRPTGVSDVRPQVLVHLDAWSMDNPPHLRWAGDLDRDGALDVLLELPTGGYSKRFLLLLSSLAKLPDLVRIAGEFQVTDC